MKRGIKLREIPHGTQGVDQVLDALMFLERFVDEGGSLLGLLVHGGVEDLLFELGVRVQLDKGFLGNIPLGMLRRRGFVCLKEVADPLVIGFQHRNRIFWRHHFIVPLAILPLGHGLPFP